MSSQPHAPGAPSGSSGAFQYLPLADLRESPLNPRKHFDPAKLAELAASIKAKGVLTPLLVRPVAKGAAYEIGAGHRRYRAANIAEIDQVPAVVREMSDTEFLELLVTENDQREDVHPLEEAAGYQALMTKAGYPVERIAERVGRSVKYVYDRVKLLQLTKEAQKLFLAGHMTAGHAILLARLSPADQERAIEEHGALFTDEHLLFTPEEEEKLEVDDEPRKPRSVREFAGWIDEHVKLDATQADPMLFPEMVQTVQAAAEEAEKIVRITHEIMTPEDAKDGQKLILGRSWKRADGMHGSKRCDHSVTGVIVIGPGRGQAFKVCVNKDKCAVHWGAEMRERQKRAKQTATTGAKAAQDRWKREEEQRERERAREEAARQRWQKAAPTVLKAVAEKVKKAAAGPSGPLARIILGAIRNEGAGAAAAAAFVPRGTKPEDLVRHVAFLILHGEALDRWYGPQHFPKRAKELGVDVQKILDEVAPTEKAAAVVARCKECGCTEDKACPGGCSWAEEPNKKTGLGLCTACRAKRKAKNPRVKGAPRRAAHASA
jgi:ParB/RepB/Spo0J family partition protein